MLKLPKSRGYVLLEALIGLMVLTVIVSLISFMMGQLYHRQQLKGCFLDAAATQLMDLQASATYPASVEKLPNEEFKKMKKVTFEKVNTAPSPTVVTVSCGEHEEVFQINAITEKKSGFLLIEHLFALVIISISLVAFMGLSTAFLKIKDRLNVPDDIKWHVAVQQMNFNYAGFRLTSFNGYDPYTAHFTNTVSEKTEVITLVSSWKDGGKIYKGAGGSGGHQPFLYGIRSLSIKRNGNRLLISTKLNQGSTFRLNFAPKNRAIYVKVKEAKEKKNDKP